MIYLNAIHRFDPDFQQDSYDFWISHFIGSGAHISLPHLEKRGREYPTEYEGVIFDFSQNSIRMVDEDELNDSYPDAVDIFLSWEDVEEIFQEFIDDRRSRRSRSIGEIEEERDSE